MPLTTLQQHLYAIGQFGSNFMGYVVTQWVMKFYFPNDPRRNLVRPKLAPWIMGIGRITDGLNDPLMGYFSDSIRTRWGRRKPFMIVGLPLLCIFFLLLWYPPAQQESAKNFWHGTLLLVGFFASFTAYVGPYTAMLPEITRGSQEQLRKVGMMQGLYFIIALITSAFVTGEAITRGMSYQRMAWLIAGVSVIGYLLPLFGPRDDPARVVAQARPGFIRSVAMTFANRPFRIYVTAYVLFLMGLMLIVQALPYIMETLLRRHEGEGATLSGIALLAGAVCIPLIFRMTQRRGTKAAFIFSLRWFAVSMPLLALLGWFGLAPWAIWLARGLVLLPGVAIGGLFALPQVVLSNIAHYDRQQTGMNREAMLFCLQGMVIKIAYSGAPMIVTGLLGYLPDHNHAVLTFMGPIAGALAVLAHVVFKRFPEGEVMRAVPQGEA